MHLKPLRPHLEEMEECDYLELEQRIPALFHVICLIWANSQHYRQPSRVVVLLQEISNVMIELVGHPLAHTHAPALTHTHIRTHTYSKTCAQITVVD